MRRTRSPAQREAICVARKWMCYLCGIRITPQTRDWQLDHATPLAGGGSDDDDNLWPVHAKCHTIKTAVDVTRIAKGKMVRQKHMGLRPSKARPMDGSKLSRWKKKMDGTVVER